MSTLAESIQIQTVDGVIDAVQSGQRLHPRGGGSKAALSTPRAATTLELSALSGILEYDPGEYTITALAGTS